MLECLAVPLLHLIHELNLAKVLLVPCLVLLLQGLEIPQLGLHEFDLAVRVVELVPESVDLLCAFVGGNGWKAICDGGGGGFYFFAAVVVAQWFFVDAGRVLGVGSAHKIKLTRYQKSIPFGLDTVFHPEPLHHAQHHDQQQLHYPPLKQTLLHLHLCLVLPPLFLSLRLLQLEELPGDVDQVIGLRPHGSDLFFLDVLVLLWHFAAAGEEVSVCLVVDQHFSLVDDCGVGEFCPVGNDGNAGFVDGFLIDERVQLGTVTSVRHM